MASFALGVMLTVLSSIFGWTLTVNIWRYAHRQRKGDDGRTWLYTAPAWWIGALGALIDMAGDEFGSGLVGQSVSVPLTIGILLAINPFWAWILNRERCYLVPDGVGSLVIVCGVMLMFSVADDDVNEYDWDDVKDHLSSSSSITGFVLVVLFAATLYAIIWKTSIEPAESAEASVQLEVGDEKPTAEAHGRGFGFRQNQWHLFPHKDCVTTNVTKFSYAGLVAALQALTCSLTVAVSYWLWSVIDGNDKFSFTKPGPLILYLMQKLSQLTVCVATSAATARVTALQYIPLYTVTLQGLNILLSEMIWGDFDGYSVTDLVFFIIGIAILTVGGVYISTARALMEIEDVPEYAVLNSDDSWSGWTFSLSSMTPTFMIFMVPSKPRESTALMLDKQNYQTI